MSEAHTPPEPDDVVQASLLTGFLGSGKTTLINALLKHPEMSDTAVLVNEFGEIGLDHHLIERIDEDTVLLNAGCLCCTVRDDLARALRELFIKRVKGDVPPFARVVIETTGLADPAPIIHTLMTDRVIANRYALDGVVTAVDGVNGDIQLGRHRESVKQAAVADRIVITKGDLAEDAELDGLEASLRALNPGASIVRAEFGAIHPDALFDTGLYDPATKSLDVQRWLRDEAYDDDHHHHDHDVNRHDDSIRAYCLRYDEPLAWEPFVGWIRTLIATHGEKLLRIKGIVNVAGQDKPIAIHGVPAPVPRPRPAPRMAGRRHQEPHRLHHPGLAAGNGRADPGRHEGGDGAGGVRNPAMRRPGSMRALEELGRVRLSPNFFMRDFPVQRDRGALRHPQRPRRSGARDRRRREALRNPAGTSAGDLRDGLGALRLPLGSGQRIRQPQPPQLRLQPRRALRHTSGTGAMRRAGWAPPPAS